MKIGKLRLKNGFFLAPMAGFSTPPFRRLCREQGAGLTTSEMISSEAVLHGSVKTGRLVARARNEKPFAIQVFGSDPKRIALAAQTLEKKCEIIDVNLGCPVRRITNQGAGAALLKTPDKIAEIFDALTTLSVPVTAKMRLGFGTKTKCVEIARLIERGGAYALTVHARTAKQDYSKAPDLDSIRKIKAAVSIPVIGNGSVFTPEDAEMMFEKTGGDGVMAGRAALGNPFIFRQLNEYFRDGEYEIPDAAERLGMLQRFLAYAKGDPVTLVRAQAIHFVAGMREAAEIRRRLMGAKSAGELREVVSQVRVRPDCRIQT